MGTPINGLFLDLYELMMTQACLEHKKNELVVFDYFVRNNPYKGGYMIFAGLNPLVQDIMSLHFSDDDIEYLQQTQMFSEQLLDYLRTFSFKGSIYAMPEGSVCFAGEPILRIQASLAEIHLIEGLLLNTLNMQTLIATKASRIANATQGKPFVELGLRRAQGNNGALVASRAAYIGGAEGTSNVLAGKTYGIPTVGTMAHSWVMAFEDEQKAFESFSTTYPTRSTFLIDTYASLDSGITHAIAIGKKLQSKGGNFGVRIDSGDIEFLSRAIRVRLDSEGCPNAKIVATNELDEYIIAYLTQTNSPVDMWGVGTKLVTGAPDSALSGVLKMASRYSNGAWQSVMKLSDDPEKASNPDIKQVYRYTDRDGMYLADLICAANEYPAINPHITHPANTAKHSYITNAQNRYPILQAIIEDGVVTYTFPQLIELRSRVSEEMNKLDSTYKRLLNPHVYKVSISDTLRDTKKSIQEKRIS